jgi:predicted aspartyl protease
MSTAVPSERAPGDSAQTFARQCAKPLKSARQTHGVSRTMAPTGSFSVIVLASGERFVWCFFGRALLFCMIRSPHLLARVCTLVGAYLSSPLATGAATEVAPPAPTVLVERAETALSEVLVEAPEPRFVAPTRRDRIGRIWAPVLINGKGPFRLVLDTGASHSAVIAHVAESLGLPAQASGKVLVLGVTGSAIVPLIHVERMEVGDLLINATVLPIVADVFGGAEGVLGREGLLDMRILADFGRDILIISRSHGERAIPGFSAIPLTLTRDGLLMADVRVGSLRAKALIDTGGQQTVGNLALREALMRHRPPDAKPEDIIGVSLDVRRGENIATAPISFGTITIRGVRVTFGEMFLFEHWALTREPALMIGMDMLGSVDTLIIDYKMRELQIRIRSDEGSSRDRGSSRP